MKTANRLIKYSILIYLLVNMTACKSIKESTTENIGKKSSVENFDLFYNKFHSDSAFQISRIKFPLEGKSMDGFEKTKWTKDNWTIMKVRIFDIDTTQYKVSYNKTDVTFTQKVWIENSGFSSEYTFELIDNKWYLVFALDQNL